METAGFGVVPAVAQGVNLGLGGFWESQRRETRRHGSYTCCLRVIWLEDNLRKSREREQWGSGHRVIGIKEHMSPEE